MLDRLRSWWTTPKRSDADFEEARQRLRESAPAPLFWLVGKTQSGKSSIIRHVIGNPDVNIGDGFRPVTRTAQQYDFPSSENPLLRFLDTRGLGEAGYDSAEDVAEFLDRAHAVIAVVRALDHAQQSVRETLEKIRQKRPELPCVFVITSLHEAYPHRQHPWPESFSGTEITIPDGVPFEISQGLERLQASIHEHRNRFQGLFDECVLVDLTQPDEGFQPHDLGLDRLKQVLVNVLPEAYGRTLVQLNQAMKDLSDLTQRKATSIILASATAASGVSAIPVPWIDLPVVTGIQTHMVYELGELYGQKVSSRRFWELAGAVGAGMATRQALKSFWKFIPALGMAIGAASGFAATYALGKVCCWFFDAIRRGHEPTRKELQEVFSKELKLAEKLWNIGHTTT